MSSIIIGLWYFQYGTNKVEVDSRLFQSRIIDQIILVTRTKADRLRRCERRIVSKNIFCVWDEKIESMVVLPNISN